MSVGNDKMDTVNHPHAETNGSDESAYLADEAAETKQAIADNVERLKASLTEAVDPIEWAREHPWTSVALSLALGFAAGAVVNPLGSKKEHDETDAASRFAEEPQPVEPPRPRPRAARASLGASALNMILEPLFEMIKVALTTILVAAVKRYSEEPPVDAAPEPDTSTQADGSPSGVSTSTM